jgi:hypothetical protein
MCVCAWTQGARRSAHAGESGRSEAARGRASEMSAVWATSLTASGIDRAGREKRRMLPISLFRHCHKTPSAVPPPPPGPAPPGEWLRGAAVATRAPPPRREGRRAESGERGSAATGHICSATDVCRSSGPNHSVSRQRKGAFPPRLAIH